MSQDSGADTVFNPAEVPLPLASGLFKKPRLEPSFGAASGRSDGQLEGAATQQEQSLEGDRKFHTGGIPHSHCRRKDSRVVGTQGSARRARVAHLPRPPGAEAEDDDSPLFPDSTEQDVAQELFTPDTFNYWKKNALVASTETFPSISQAYHNRVQGMKSNTSAIANGPTLEWEDLSLGIQWIILLRLCAKWSFSVAVFNQLKLHKTQIQNFVTTYIDLCDEWHGWEQAAKEQSLLHTAKADSEGSSLVEWLHENRPKQPIDEITDEDAQKGLQFLSEREVLDHNVDFDEWVKNKELKCFVNIQIEKAFLEDATDLLIVQRAAETNLLSPYHLEQMLKNLAIDIRNNEHNAHV